MFVLYRVKLYVAKMLDRFPNLKRMLRIVYIRIFHDATAEKALYRRLNGRKGVFFIQIGSNDGKTNDPMFELIKTNVSWRGIFVEPSPDAFAELKKNYGNEERFIFENVGISNQNGVADFYMVRASDAKKAKNLPICWPRVGSFSEEHVIRHINEPFSHLISRVRLKTISFESLIERNNVERIDMLHLDTEGYDSKILEQIDFNRRKPGLILFEHKHLHRDDRLRVYLLLANNHYLVKPIGYDTLAELSAASPVSVLQKAAQTAFEL